METKKTALYEKHKNLNGNIVDFSGFSLPVFYSSIKEEHIATRTNIGIFDVSHMGNFSMNFPSKEKAISFFNYLLPNDFSKIEPGKCIYSPMLYEDGGVVDDLIVMSLTETEYHIVVNCANIDKDFNWIKDQITDPSITLLNISEALSIIAIQGPNALGFIDKTFGFKVTGLRPFRLIKESFDGSDIIVSTTGYTGEKGVEVIIANDRAPAFFDMLMEKGKKTGITPCGLGARDTLRLEAGYPLYGHELDDNHSPLQANIAWCIKLNKESDFIGKKAISDSNNDRFKDRITGFIVESRSIPRAGMEIVDSNENVVGKVTSGSYSPTLEKNIGIAYITPESAGSDSLKVKIRKKIEPITLVELPFYKRTK